MRPAGRAVQVNAGGLPCTQHSKYVLLAVTHVCRHLHDLRHSGWHHIHTSTSGASGSTTGLLDSHQHAQRSEQSERSPQGVLCLLCLLATQHTSQGACLPAFMPDLNLVASQALHTHVKSVSSSQVARLWAGYGTVTAVQAVTDSPAAGASGGGAGVHHLIVKQVDPPKGAGISHTRKLQSYAVEASFYTHCAPAVLASGLPCHLPQPLYLEVQPPTHFLFVLSDLRQQSFREERHSYDLQETQVALDWLAAFHAFWWEQPPATPPPAAAAAAGGRNVGSSSGAPTAASAASSAAELWEEGCYWHLDTRQEELQQMGGRWKALQAAAPHLDKALKGYSRSGHLDLSHRTLVHGDFKSANVVFTKDGRQCAAYDFQYVGGGWGMKDVVYMLCSSADEDVWEQHEAELLGHYHTQLLRHLHTLGKHSAAERYTHPVLQRHYKLCLMDYVRFMAGWGMWGNSSYAAAKCKEWLPGLQDLL